MISIVNFVLGLKTRKVHVHYAVELLGTGSYFSANVTKNKLSCFGNRDYGNPTYRDAMICMMQLYFPFKYNCNSIWGSRSVVIDAIGSIEFLKLNHLPKESNFEEPISMNVSRWLELPSSNSKSYHHHVKQVPAEPLYLCVRSNDWINDGDGSFKIIFRPSYQRDNDQLNASHKAYVHFFLIIALSSIKLLPYIVAMVVAIIAYLHGIKFFIVSIIFSFSIVCLTPLMLTKKKSPFSKIIF